MKDRQQRIPGPDHPITIERDGGRIVVSSGGHVVADTREALLLKEAAYAPVAYIPRKDIDMSLLERTEHSTYCPYKGDLRILQHSCRRSEVSQCRLDLRSSFCGGG